MLLIYHEKKPRPHPNYRHANPPPTLFKSDQLFFAYVSDGFRYKIKMIVENLFNHLAKTKKKLSC